MIVNIDDNPDIVAVIVTLGTKIERLKRCIASLTEQQTNRRLGLLCIINNSEFQASVLEGIKVTTLITGLNLGFAGALAFSRQFITADYLWVIQDDMRVSHDCLEELFLTLNSSEDIGAVSPVVLNNEGLVVQASCGGVLDPSGKMNRWLPQEPTPIEKLIDLEQLSYIPSRGMLIKNSAWDKVKGVDPRYYPVTWTDVDFCTALKYHGINFKLVLTAIARHEVNGSTSPLMGEFVYYRNNELFINKWINNNTEKNINSNNVGVHDKIDRLLLSAVAQNAAAAFLKLCHECSLKMRDMEEKNYFFSVEQDNKIKALHHEYQLQATKLHHIEHELKNVYSSISWRITQPLRSFKAMVSRIILKH